MSEYTDRVRNHQIWKELDALGPAIDRAAGRPDNSGESIDSLERLRSVLTFCGRRLSGADPYLTALNLLSTLHSHLTAARVEIETFFGDGNIVHLATANNHADNALATVAGIVSANEPEELTFLSEAAGNYRAAIGRLLSEAQSQGKSIAAEAGAIKVAVTELTAQVAAEKQGLAAIVTDQQTKFGAAQDLRASEFTVAQTDRQEKYTALIGQQQTAYTAAQTERQEKYSALVSDHATKLAEQNTDFTAKKDDAIKTYQKDLAALHMNYEELARGTLARIDEHKRQVEKLVGVIGNLGVTSGYQKIANHARVALYLWQFLTVSALSLLIYFAYLIAFEAPTIDTAFYQGMATRIFLSITVGVFAAYAARQASNSWQIERRNRKLALELEALGPYISTLPPDMQNKFRIDVGDRSFGVPDEDLHRLGDKSPVTAIDLMKSKDFKEFIVDIVKAVKS